MNANQLFKHIHDVGGFTAALVTLAEFCPERLTVAQMCFFLLAAKADISGQPTTFSAIKEEAGPTVNRSLHTTYKVFLEGPNRKDRPAPRQKGLNWLRRELNPKDERQKFLRLTPKGHEVMATLVGKINSA